VEKMRKVLSPVKVPGTDRIPVMSVGIAEAVLQEKFDAVDIVTEVINRVEGALEVAKKGDANRVKALQASLPANVA
jgi:hypothetical protein